MRSLRGGLPDEDARALTFVSLVLVYPGLVVVNRSFGASPWDFVGQRNSALVWVAGATVSMLALVLAVPLGRDLFRFGPLHWDDFLLVAGVVAGVVAVLEVLKRFWRASLAR